MSWFRATFSSPFHQKVLSATVDALCNQSTWFEHLPNIVATICYCRSRVSLEHSASFVVFCDAGRSSDAGQICRIGGLLIGSLECSSDVHETSWLSQRSPRPICCTSAAKTITAGKGIKICKVLAHVYRLFLQMNIFWSWWSILRYLHNASFETSICSSLGLQQCCHYSIWFWSTKRSQNC